MDWASTVLARALQHEVLMTWIAPERSARWRASAGRQWSRLAVGARRAALCVAFASAWLGAWLLGVWWSGDRWVYADARALAEAAAPLVGSPRVGSSAEHTPVSRGSLATPVDEEAANEAGRPRFERVAGVDPAIQPFAPLHAASYPLDSLSRAVTGHCPDVKLQEFAGETIAFQPVARVAPEFAGRLVELESIVDQLARVFYGRAPSAILVAASHDCRSVSGKNQRLSEHAFGNAIDITGFRFDAPSGTEGTAFDVRVAQHWKATGDAERLRHARFLDALTQALLARDVFRTMLGPAHPDHADHFHFDMAPSYYVDL